MKLDWRRAITYITTAGMEGCWLYSIAALLNVKVADGRLSIPALMLVYVVSFAFNRLLLRRRLQSGRRAGAWRRNEHHAKPRPAVRLRLAVRAPCHD